MKLYTRALKYCNFVSEFWIEYMIELEAKGEIKDEFEQITEMCNNAI